MVHDIIGEFTNLNELFVIHLYKVVNVADYPFLLNGKNAHGSISNYIVSAQTI